MRAIEDGDITIEGDPGFAGDVAYKASNGWTIVVFNDCNDWDYIASIKTDDGREIDFDELSASMPEIADYRPSEEVSVSRYGIGGVHEQTLLCDGLVMGDVIECPMHNGRFDYTSGKALGAPVLVDLRTYPTRVIDGTVYIDVG